MANKCLIIMPPGEPNGYPQGHINRVYEYIIVPACRLAGYWPTRADNATHDDPLEAVREIVDSDVAICDVSANNVNALYGLAIRDVLGLPTTVVKDMKSVVTFDTRGLGIMEYDDSLRIDTVQKAIEVLSEALKKAVDSNSERNPLLSRLNIGVTQIAPADNSSADLSTSPPPEETKELRLPIISPLPDYVDEPFTDSQIGKLKAGDFFFHLNHGKGKINFVKKDRLASVQFDSGPKFLVLAESDFFRKIK
jgi:hypothetical protein